jgi:hypothetical protein
VAAPASVEAGAASAANTAGLEAAKAKAMATEGSKARRDGVWMFKIVVLWMKVMLL